MMNPSDIHPDVELRDFLQDRISVGTAAGSTENVIVYGDWERPTNGVPDDFLVVYINGDVGGVGMKTDYADGFILVSLYTKLKDDGSVKKQRIDKILQQFDNLIEGLTTDNYHYRYDTPRFITPPTPDLQSGYSITTLNLRWHTSTNFNKTV